MSDTNETDRLLAVKVQVKKVENITRDNLDKVIDRGDHLDDLQRRAESLSTSAVEFNVTAHRVKRKMCWRNVKLWIILLFLLFVILVVLIVALVAALKQKK